MPLQNIPSLFLTLADRLEAGVAVITPDLEVVYINPAWQRLLPEFSAGQRLVCPGAASEHGPIAACLHCVVWRAFTSGQDQQTRFARPAAAGDRLFELSVKLVAEAQEQVKSAYALLELVPATLHARSLTEWDGGADQRTAILQEVIEGIPAPVFFKDRTGAYQLCNQAFAEQVLALPKAKIVGRTVFQLPARIPPERAAVYHRADSELMESGGTQRYETEVRWSDGSTRTVHFFKWVVAAEGGEPAGIVGVMLDITERKRMELALMAARQEAEAAARGKETFLATLSHEVRTPLGAIIGMADLLSQSNLQDEQRELVELIDQAGSVVLKLLSGILDASKAQSGKLRLAEQAFDLEELVEGVAEILAPQAEAKGLELTCLVAPEARLTLVGDTNRLQQILFNLLANGIKFTEQGNVNLRASATARDERRVLLRVEVSDTGVGVPRHRQAAIFDSFVQADESAADPLGGTGLGLSICRSLITLMGGQIGIESIPGRGSTFWVEVPLGVRSRAAEQYDPQLEGARILVLEDNEQSSGLLAQILAEAGGRPRVVRQSAIAQALVAASSEEGESAFDIVVIDEGRPAHGAVGLLEDLGRRQERMPPVVLLRAVGQPAPPEGSSVAAVLTKPVRRRQLLQAVAGVLAGGASPGAPLR